MLSIRGVIGRHTSYCNFIEYISRIDRPFVDYIPFIDNNTPRRSSGKATTER